MQKLFRSLVLLCAFALIAAACGGDDETDGALAFDAESTSTTTTTIAEPEQEAITSSTSTTTTIPSGPVFPLSGEQLTNDNQGDHAAVVVKISNNDETARDALLGLDQADIVFEERIEQEATRFAAVFHSSLPTEVGSVRSARTSDVQILSNLNTPVFAFSGANDGVNGQVREAENDGLLIRSSSQLGDIEFRRISEFSAPNNLVVDTVALLDNAPDSAAPQPIFDYSNNAAELGAPTPGVRIPARTNAVFVWDEDSEGFLAFQGGMPLESRDGVHVTPANVIVLTTTYVASQIDAQSVDATTIGSNPVTVYSNGFRVEGTWTRDFARDGYTLETPDGQTIGLAPGQTWVSLAPAGVGAELSQQNAEVILEG